MSVLPHMPIARQEDSGAGARLSGDGTHFVELESLYNLIVTLKPGSPCDSPNRSTKLERPSKADAKQEYCWHASPIYA